MVLKTAKTKASDEGGKREGGKNIVPGDLGGGPRDRQASKEKKATQ